MMRGKSFLVSSLVVFVFIFITQSWAHDIVFEGPEKRLEVHFKPIVGEEYNVSNSLRSISKPTWDGILELAHCRIISIIGNDQFEAYLLSESSLFVYANKIVIKTCGTTRLLQALPRILEEAKARALEASSVLFSRKNYFDSHLQHFPHKSFDDEVSFLKQLFHGGHNDVLGPIDGDHYCVYTYDKEDIKKYDPLAELMMSDLDPTLMNLYCKDSSPFSSSVLVDPQETCAENISKILDLIPGGRNDDYYFDPCGYSLNGVQEQNYYTIHVSPQGKNSYASFESTVVTGPLLNHILEIFRPSRFSYTFYAEDDADPNDTPPQSFPGYHLSHKTTMNYGYENSKKLVFFNFDKVNPHH